MPLKRNVLLCAGTAGHFFTGILQKYAKPMLICTCACILSDIWYLNPDLFVKTDAFEGAFDLRKGRQMAYAPCPDGAENLHAPPEKYFLGMCGWDLRYLT